MMLPSRKPIISVTGKFSDVLKALYAVSDGVEGEVLWGHDILPFRREPGKIIFPDLNGEGGHVTVDVSRWEPSP